MAPVIPVVQHDRFSLFFSVRIELYLYTIRTFAILIICITPALGHCYTGLSGGVAVDHIIAIYLYRIIRDRILGNGVGNLCSILILRKVCEAPAPVVICADCFFIYFFTIGKQIDCDRFRTFAVLIICIIPGLASGYFCCLWNMTVRECITRCCISGAGHLILCAVENDLAVSFSDFFYGILDCISCGFFIQFRPCMAPVILGVQHNRFSLFFSVRIELYLYTIRTFAILIICITPALGHCYTGLSGGVAVDHIIAIYLYRIIRDRILCNGVGNLFSVLILRKILELPFPTIISCNCQFFVFQFLSICQQMNLNICRAFSVLIIRIIPGLAS